MSNVKYLYIRDSKLTGTSKEDPVQALTAAFRSIAFKWNGLGEQIFVDLDSTEDVQEYTGQGYTARIELYISSTQPRTVSAGPVIKGNLGIGSEELTAIKVSLSLPFLDDNLVIRLMGNDVPSQVEDFKGKQAHENDLGLPPSDCSEFSLHVSIPRTTSTQFTGDTVRTSHGASSLNSL